MKPLSVLSLSGLACFIGRSGEYCIVTQPVKCAIALCEQDHATFGQTVDRHLVVGHNSCLYEPLYPVRPWVAVIFLPELACISGGNLRPNWVQDSRNRRAARSIRANTYVSHKQGLSWLKLGPLWDMLLQLS